MIYFLDKTITIRRMQYRSGFKTFSATGTAVISNWQEPAPEYVDMYGGTSGNLYNVFTDLDCMARPSDQFVRDSIIYDIRDMKVVDFGSYQFRRYICSGSIDANTINN